MAPRTQALNISGLSTRGSQDKTGQTSEGIVRHTTSIIAPHCTVQSHSRAIRPELHYNMYRAARL